MRKLSDRVALRWVMSEHAAVAVPDQAHDLARMDSDVAAKHGARRMLPMPVKNTAEPTRRAKVGSGCVLCLPACWCAAACALHAVLLSAPLLQVSTAQHKCMHVVSRSKHITVAEHAANT